jgi:hypothetical protein
LRPPNGEVFDSCELVRCDWQPGDVLIWQSNTRWRVTAVVPGELVGEFVDGREVDGLLEVEPL